MANYLEDSQMTAMFEPLLKYHYVFYLPGPGGDLVPHFLIAKAARPKMSSDQVQIDYLNITRWVKGKTRFEQISIQITDSVSPSGTQAIMKWFRAHHEHVSGRDGYSDNYFKEARVLVLGPTGDKVQSWVYKNCWMKSIDFGDLDYSAGSDKLSISVTLRYDYAILQG